MSISNVSRPFGSLPTAGTTATTGPAATTATTSVSGVGSAPVDSMDRSGSASGLRRVGNKVKDVVVERAWAEVSRQHDFKIADVGLGDHGTLGLRVDEKILLADDPAVKNHALRTATNNEIKAAGKTPVWIATGGLIEGSAGYGTSVPVSGVVNMHAGFSASALLRYRTTQPYAVSAGQMAKDLLKNNSVDMPFSSENARAMKPGAEFELQGAGSASISGGVSAGVTGTAGNFTGSLSAGISASGTRSANYGINVKRLEGDRVHVVVSEVQARSASVGASLSAGISINGAAAMPEVGDGKLGELIEKEGASKLESAVRDYTAFSASASTTTSSSNRTLASYVIDLSKPEGQKAYEDLMRLSNGAAERASKKADAGVTMATFDGTTNATGSDAQVTFAGKRLLLHRALRSEENGTLTTPDAVKLTRTSKYEKDFSFVVTGERKVKWEGINVRDPASGANETYFNMRFTGVDKQHSDQDVATFVRFADIVGIKDADPRAVKPNGMNWLERLFSDRDNAKLAADIYFTRGGIQKMVATPEADVIAAFARTAATLDPKLGEIPHRNPEAVKVLREYAQLSRFLEAARSNDTTPEMRAAGYGFGDSQEQQNSIQRDMQALYHPYKRAAPGRDLSDDAKVMGGADQLAAAVKKMGTSGDEAGWATLFGDIGKAEGFDYMRTIGAMATLAGEEDTLVHELSLDAKDVHLKSVDEGRLTHPDEQINRAIYG